MLSWCGASRMRRTIVKRLCAIELEIASKGIIIVSVLHPRYKYRRVRACGKTFIYIRNHATNKGQIRLGTVRRRVIALSAAVKIGKAHTHEAIFLDGVSKSY